MDSSTQNTEAAARDIDAHVAATVKPVKIDGHEFRIEPMRVKQVFPFLQRARPIFAALASASSPQASDLPPAPAGQGGEPSAATEGTAPAAPAAPPLDMKSLAENTELVLDLLQQHGEAAVEALALGTDTPVALVERLTLPGLFVLAKHFVVVNAGFFADQGLRLPQVGPVGAAASAPAAPNPPRRKR